MQGTHYFAHAQAGLSNWSVHLCVNVCVSHIRFGKLATVIQGILGVVFSLRVIKIQSYNLCPRYVDNKMLPSSLQKASTVVDLEI